MACAARSSGRVMLNDPRCDLASGVRELATMTASRMVVSIGRNPIVDFSVALDDLSVLFVVLVFVTLLFV